MKESFAAKKRRARKILDILKQTYPDARCALKFETVFQLLVAVILSAQCNDVQVNKVTPKLFAHLPTPEAFASAPLEKIELLIRSTGLYKNKAKNIKAAAEKIMRAHNGEVPKSMKELIALPGVGRKTANVILETGFGINAGVTVDTHVLRISNLIEIISKSAAGKPEKVETELMKLFPREDWGILSHTLIFHGRRICIARRPKCSECPVVALCPGRRL